MLQAAVPVLVLASQSAARGQLLRDAGLSFSTCPASVDEAAIKANARSDNLPAAETALLLADAKARHVGLGMPDALVIGADQILVCAGRWLDKPVSAHDARRQLQFLRGREHTLVTAVVCHRNGARVWQHVSQPCLEMRAFSDAFLEAYIAAENDHLTHSVGGYRLEGPGVQLFARVDGAFSDILGLPLLPLLEFLRHCDVLRD